jgi:hypothetical protein
MKQKAIDPVEIITNDSRILREKKRLPDAWTRLLARCFDYALIVLVLNILQRLGIHLTFVGFIPLPFVLYIPIEAVCLMTWGTTLGKWLLKINIRQGRKLSLDPQVALRRSFNVWFRGIGMGISYISVICLFVSYYRLSTFGQTSWDREEYITVSCETLPSYRLAIACGFIFIVFLIFSF